MEGTFAIVCMICDAPLCYGADGKFYDPGGNEHHCTPRPTLYDWTQEKDTNG